MSKFAAKLPPNNVLDGEFRGDDVNFDDTYKTLMLEYCRSIDNNKYADKSRGIALKTRRDKSIPY